MSHSCKDLCKTERFKNLIDNENITIGSLIKIRKCSTCEIRFINGFNDWYCPCCGNGVRTRNTYCREKKERKRLRSKSTTLNLSGRITKTITVNGVQIGIVVRGRT